MPFGYRTGHLGLGPRTGRTAGYCSRFGVPGYVNPIAGRGRFEYSHSRGRGCGWSGRGRGWRHRYWATGLPGWTRGGYCYPPLGGYPYGPEITAKEEMNMLMKEQPQFLEQQMDEIQKRIDTLEKTKAQDNE